MVFCTPEEAFGDRLNWERNLEQCAHSFKEKFASAVKGLPDTSSVRDIVNYFEHLKRRNGNQQKFIVIGGDLTKSDKILDVCGVLQFYDIHYVI